MTLHRCVSFRLSVAVAVSTMVCLACAAAQPALKPNVVFILTDDQGYGDMSCHGNPVLKTPNLDDNLGRLLAKLKEWDIDRQTLVVFMNDNGGTAGVNFYNAGMRGPKGTPWEGGTRAASFWRWPGTLQPADVNALTAHIDFFPTLAELAGAPLTDKVRQQVEGRSLVPLLKNPNASWFDRILFTHVGRWELGKVTGAKYRNCSVRNSRWHLVCASKTGEKEWQLFDVKADPGEKTDVVAQHPEVVQELDAAYDRWWNSVQPQLVNENAVGPKVNPFTACIARLRGESGAGPS